MWLNSIMVSTRRDTVYSFLNQADQVLGRTKYITHKALSYLNTSS